jgi:hypothetical protein
MARTLDVARTPCGGCSFTSRDTGSKADTRSGQIIVNSCGGIGVAVGVGDGVSVGDGVGVGDGTTVGVAVEGKVRVTAGEEGAQATSRTSRRLIIRSERLGGRHLRRMVI